MVVYDSADLEFVKSVTQVRCPIFSFFPEKKAVCNVNSVIGESSVGSVSSLSSVNSVNSVSSVSSVNSFSDSRLNRDATPISDGIFTSWKTAVSASI